jgi:hypothetical protein
MKKKHENRKNPLLILPTPSIPFQRMDPKTQGPSKREGALSFVTSKNRSSMFFYGNETKWHFTKTVVCWINERNKELTSIPNSFERMEKMVEYRSGEKDK